MTENVFITRNEKHWQALEAYNHRLIRGGIRKMVSGDVRAFAKLFRLTSYHLAYAKTHYPESDCLLYLNRIVSTAHNHYYVRETGSFSEIKQYVTHGFPAAVRHTARYFFAAAALFFIGLLFACLYVAMDVTRFAQIYPSDALNGGMGVADNWDYPLMSAVIMSNNIRVAISAFAFGIFAGIGTLYVLVYNGIVVGGLTGYLAQSGANMTEFLSLLLPHGILELTAIFLSGACGLIIGKAIVIPGPYRRRDALVKSAKTAVTLIPGVVVMLILAGIIEGFFTPLPIAPFLKLLFAGATLVVFVLYIMRGRVRLPF